MNDNFENNKNGYDGYSSDNNTADNSYQDIHSSSDSQSASTAENTESSYEWNTNSTSSLFFKHSIGYIFTELLIGFIRFTVFFKPIFFTAD